MDHHGGRPRAERARALADALRQQVTDDAFADGVLPDERDLGRRFGASRNAVRDALALLREEGLITRRRGVGTTVLLPKYAHGLDRLTGLAEELTGRGTVTNEVRVAVEVPALPAAIASRLEVPAGAGGVYVERLRRLDGLPLSLDTSYLTVDVGRAVLAGDLRDRDVFGLIEEAAGARLGRAEVAVHAVNADPGTAAGDRARVGGVRPGTADPAGGRPAGGRGVDPDPRGPDGPARHAAAWRAADLVRGGR
ncbi:GntR family transcriptional regulator [Streptomyces anthocyanicus]